jgi:hypothetical protein
LNDNEKHVEFLLNENESIRKAYSNVLVSAHFISTESDLPIKLLEFICNDLCEKWDKIDSLLDVINKA